MEEHELQQQVAKMEVDVQALRAQRALSEAADNALEDALRRQCTLDKTLALLFPLVGEHLGAEVVWIRTYDESLHMRDFFWSGQGADGTQFSSDKVRAATEQGQLFVDGGDGRTIIGQPLDVAGDHFGSAACVINRELSKSECSCAQKLLDVWCEQLDNYLAFIAMARRKHSVVTALSTALKQPVLAFGISKAIEVLLEYVDFDDLVLVYRHDEVLDGANLSYKIVKDRKVIHDSHNCSDMEMDAVIQRCGVELLARGDARAMAERFGFRQFREEVLINGIKRAQIVGRILVSSGHRREFSTFERDLLELFADFLRQRIVDFNREWRHLSLCFPRGVVQRLLGEEDYIDRYLMPKEREVAVLYCDISGFTHVSEQVLQKPALIGKLVNAWSSRVVEIIWELGGVFDKMVGDCIIGLWGPPFFEMSAEDACLRAAQAAVEIRDFTHTMGDVAELPELQKMEQPLGVATGVNFCPLLVGLFGPNEDYTGFSSGMNNAARLQGVASRDEILCMESFVQAIGARGVFSESREAKVKNVAEPLQFRALTEIP